MADSRWVNPPGQEEPCGVEGCGRVVVPYGDDVACGLLKLFPGQRVELPECGTTRTVDKWIEEGLLDGLGGP